VVEETRQRTVEGGADDEAIRSLLLTAAREATDPGVRLETLDLLSNQSSSADVREAFLTALQHDAEPNVRLKAIQGLQGRTHDTETRRVLTQVLLNDGNPGVQNEAMDLLMQVREPGIVSVLQELASREDNDTVRLKCRKALQEMKASVESF